MKIKIELQSLKLVVGNKKYGVWMTADGFCIGVMKENEYFKGITVFIGSYTKGKEKNVWNPKSIEN